MKESLLERSNRVAAEVSELIAAPEVLVSFCNALDEASYQLNERMNVYSEQVLFSVSSDILSGVVDEQGDDLVASIHLDAEFSNKDLTGDENLTFMRYVQSRYG